MTVTLPYPLTGKRVWVAGEHGMVGSALVRRLASENCELLRLPRRAIDFRDQASTAAWIANNRPDVIFLAAAKVGGIAANAASPASFLYDNLMIETNVIHAAHEAGVDRLVFLGSTCIYPKFAPQPIPEEALLTGPLEETNEWYAVAKIAGVKLTQAYRRQYGRSYISCQPTNLYGPGDNYDLETSHVLPALIRTIETRTGIKVCCPEEIAFYAGWIDEATMMQRAGMLGKTEYAAYLRRVLADGNGPRGSV